MMTLALDGMGVIYSARDDVLELLCPFIAEKGGIKNSETIERIYVSASLGEITSEEFWRAVKVDPGLENEYLGRHSLNRGLIEFLELLHAHDVSVWGLSNDISEWSRKLRTNFKLEPYFRGFTVSGDVHARKPESLIYRLMMKHSGTKPEEVIFVDDRLRNLDAAAALGFKTVLFDATGAADSQNKHCVVNSFPQLQEWLIPLIGTGKVQNS